jgi:predicted O-methyltransferase YrrM
MKPLTEAEEVSEIAFAFMGSKALFTALHLDFFTHLEAGPLTPEALAERAGVDEDRAVTLLTALHALGLVTRDGEAYANSPAASTFLSKSGRHDFGDYLRFQIDRQMYPFLEQLEPAVAGRLAPDTVDSYEKWMSDPEEARLYSASQHAGSLSPGKALARIADLSGARSLLDVGGGTGAFAISLCQANPALHATIVDFPNVATVGREFIAEAGLSQRIRYLEGNALEVAWPGGQDAIVMSYLFSSIPGDAIADVVERAREALVPGGRLFVHDFMVNPDRSGPKLAALWQLQHTAFNPQARSVSTDWATGTLRVAGFADVEDRPLIPGLTTLVSGRKPA